jgi:hypothetical protein
MATWQYTFQLVRFLAPVVLMDYVTTVHRPDVIAAFAAGNPRVRPGQQSLPPVYIGLWGGLLEGGRLAIGRDPVGGQVTGELEFP